MRDPKRISETLEALKTIWQRYPDLRLMQLLQVIHKENDPYYLEDKELLKKIREYL